MKNKIIVILVITTVIVIIGIIMLGGSIDVKYGESSFDVEASFWNNITVEYSAIDKIEYRDSDSIGKRTLGFENTHLMIGNFKNDEFDKYIRYSNIGCEACIVIFYDGKILVINGVDNEGTKSIYDELMIRKQ